MEQEISRTPDQKSLVILIARTSTIAVIAMVTPLGIDISGDGFVSFGASFCPSEGQPRCLLMRVFSLIAVVLFVSSLAAPARAEMNVLPT